MLPKAAPDDEKRPHDDQRRTARLSRANSSTRSKRAEHVTIVADENECGALLFAQLAHELEHIVRIAGVERARWFVREHQDRTIGQRARHRRSLLLTHRELPRVVTEARGETHSVEQRFRERCILPSRKLMASSTFS